MMNDFNWDLNRLAIDTNSNTEGRRSLTSEEMFVLSWLIFYNKDRDYHQLMRDCKLSKEQCEIALQGLTDLGLLYLR